MKIMMVDFTLMPGMNGLNLACKIVEINPNEKIVLISAHPFKTMLMMNGGSA